ncbi:beta-N-acetylhexosaminidase [Fulvivirgaceae bacterium BMA12]|uniref:beta-N-acetylhexosaminidase n=1 Tax=Agaribacillus aureus TaxID=3051825 RepID=A0ABT8L7N3_9BACT|nr:beta-N-acetylhexosaminidase [Fulvivirgaceae bacterium BMA12]
MKKVITLLFSLFYCFAIVAQERVSIIPKPNRVEIKHGTFLLDTKAQIIHDKNTREIAEYLQVQLAKDVGLSLPSSRGEKQGNSILLQLDKQGDRAPSSGHYTLEIGTSQVLIKAPDHQGLFYGIQTLRQLALAGEKKGKGIVLSVLHIADQPRFTWRAFMLDEARNFKGIDQVKKLLDQMALLKLNVFHWHLTDDQGWRIEIKKYPLLTQIGSKRKDTQIGGWKSEEMTGVPHDGFYTQDQIKEIVQYAADRYITVIPEIEMPGHSSAAIAAYPWLGTSGKEIEVPVVFGKMPDTYNVVDPKVYEFLTDVLDEVMTLFPSDVIHIGGDEVKYDQWKESKAVAQFMKDNGLNSPVDLQIHFTNKISQYLQSKGKRMMGWNEIMGHNVHDYQKKEDTRVGQQLAKNTIIHFWKGDLALARNAIESGYDIVNSLHSMTYLDYNYKSISLEKAYGFDPVPAGLEIKYHDKVIGMGCQMWGEWIPTVEQMDRQVFPRLAAYAEVGWTQKANKNYDDFFKNLDVLKSVWERAQISYPADL